MGASSCIIISSSVSEGGADVEERLGFIHGEMELKVLILFILRRLPERAAFDELTDMTLLTDGAIDYFDFTESLSDLERTGHVDKDGDGYLITEKGKVNGEAMETSLPYSVRVRAEKAAATLANLQRRRGMIEASHRMRNRGGFTVHLAMSDGLGPILSLDLLTGDDKQSALIEENFKKNAEKLYGKIVELLMNEL